MEQKKSSTAKNNFKLREYLFWPYSEFPDTYTLFILHSLGYQLAFHQ